MEDDEEIRANLTHVFRRSPDFRLLGSYPDAESAMLELPHCAVDAVLMDIQRPGMDGLEAARHLRAAGHDPASLPIIAVTANGYDQDIAACRAAGMQGHLVKPLRVATLAAELERIGPQRAAA